MRASRVIVPAALLLVIGFAAPANAAITIVGSSITGDNTNENITVSCVAGALDASGVTGGPCAPLTSISVNPNGGTDTVDLSGVTAAAFPALLVASVNANDGEADTVIGSPLSDVITGDFADALNGNAGNDELTGGGSVSGGLGDDTIIEFTGASLASGGPGDDRFVQFIPQGGLEGGSGFDSWDVDFDQESPQAGANLDVTLTADTVHIVLGPTDLTVPVGGLEQAYWTLLRGDAQSFNGAAFPGVLNIRGMAGVDTLTGGPSDDALYGGGDNDTVTGGLGADVLHGGDGDDTIQARDGVADRVDCGTGTDSVVADAADVVVNCETVSLPPVVTPPPPPPPAVVPVTSAVSGPKKVTVPKKATFTFSSTTPGATFQCKVDDKAFKACASPFKIATKKLKVGKHTLLVRAVVGGVVDATPSKKTFKVKKG